MLVWLKVFFLGMGFVGLAMIIISIVSIIAVQDRKKRYMEELRNVGVGKTVVKISETTSIEVFVFSTMQEAIEHPQEIIFDPNKNIVNNRETVLRLRCCKQPIEVWDGENFKMVSDSEILTVTIEKEKRYLYLRIKDNKIC